MSPFPTTNANTAAAARRRARRLTVIRAVLEHYVSTLRLYRAPPQPRHTSVLTGPRFMFEILTGSPWRIRHLFRMPKDTFLSLAKDLRGTGMVPNPRFTIGPSVEEKLGMFLFIVAHAASNRDTQDRFQRSADTVRTAFHDVLAGLYSLYHEHVNPPPDEIPEEIKRRHGKMKEFVNCRREIFTHGLVAGLARVVGRNLRRTEAERL